MRRFGRILAVLGIFLLVRGGSADAAPPDRSADAALDVMPDTGDRFEAADELLAAKKWARALDKLAQIADEAEDTVWSDDGKIYAPVTVHIRNRMISMPAEGLAFYRLQYDPEAGAMFREGLSKQSVPALDGVDARYPASSFAAQALDAAASVLIDQARFDDAADRLLRLLARPVPADASRADTQLRAAALAKLAFCMARLGDDGGSAGALERLRKLGVAGEVRIGGGGIGLDALVRAALVRSGPAYVPERADAWPMPGGSLLHDRPMRDVGFKLSKRWEHKIGDDSKWPVGPTVINVRSSISLSYHAGPGAIVPSVSPLPATDAEGVVYVSTGREVFAFDHITGRVRWSTKPQAAPSQGGRQVTLWMAQNQVLAMAWPSWQGGASVSVGGGKVFALEHSGTGFLIFRALSAFDAATGSRLWSLRQRNTDGGFESEACFPWAPKFVELSDGPAVVGLALHRDQMFLCSLDANTGKLKWKVYVCADPTQAMAMYGRSASGPAWGQPVIISGGVAYAATGMGVAAAVDVSNGRVRWISRYPRSAIRVVGGDPRLGRATNYQHQGGWQAGFPVLAGSRLFVAPSDANELVVFDRRTGAIVGQIPRGEFTHFAGVRNGDVIFTGKETAAVDARTGVFRWLVPTPFAPEGIPVLSETALLIPAKGQLCEITLDGPVVRRLHSIAGANTDLPLGNIVCCEGRLIAANRAYVTAYFSFEETYAFLSKKIEQDPKSVKTLLDRADLCYLHGKYADSLRDALAAENAMGPGAAADAKLAERLKRMMFETRLMLSEHDAPNAVMHADAARAYIFSDVARVRFHIARAAALIAGKRYQDAVDEYVTIAEKMAGVKLTIGSTSGPAATIAQALTGELVRRHGIGVYARADARIRAKYDRAALDKDAAALRELYLAHPHGSLADNCLFELAGIAIKEKYGLGRAQNYLLSLTRLYPHSELLGEAFGMLLVNCEQSGRYHLAGTLLRDVREKHPLVVIPWKGENVPGGALCDRLMKLDEFRRAARGRGLPVLIPPLRMVWETETGFEVPVTVISGENCFDRGIGLAADVVPGRQPHQYYGRITRLRAFDVATGRTLWTSTTDVHWSMGDIERDDSPWGRSKFRALVACSGGVAALCHPDGVVAFDIATGRRLWEKTWKRPAAANPMQWFDHRIFGQMHHLLRQSVNMRPVFASDAGRLFCYLPDTRLMCVDVATGRALWEARDKGFARGAIGLFDDIVAVAGIQPNTIIAYDALSGRKVYSKEQPGTLPGRPAYDTARRLIFVADGSRVLCHRADDFRQVWASQPEKSTYLASQPWYIQVLSGEQIAVLRYNRVGDATGYELVMFDAENGNRAWAVFASKYVRKGRDYTRTNVSQAPVFGSRFVFIPAQHYERKYVNKGYQTKQGLMVLVLDRKTGKTLRECRQEGENIYPFSVTGTAEHAVIIVREYDRARGRHAAKLQVVSGETAKSALSVGLSDIPTSGILHNLMLQRMSAVATIDGKVIVPTYKGLTCCGAGGAAPEPEPKDKKNEKQ
ncbi:MAG: PQQ-binding-like beta-propeller repeat protein [Planctomycetota bacterium]